MGISKRTISFVQQHCSYVSVYHQYYYNYERGHLKTYPLTRVSFKFGGPSDWLFFSQEFQRTNSSETLVSIAFYSSLLFYESILRRIRKKNFWILVTWKNEILSFENFEWGRHRLRSWIFLNVGFLNDWLISFQSVLLIILKIRNEKYH